MKACDDLLHALLLGEAEQAPRALRGEGGGPAADDAGDRRVAARAAPVARAAGPATVSSAASILPTVMLRPGGLMPRSRPSGAVSIVIACRNHSTARRGEQIQTANSSGTGSSVDRPSSGSRRIGRDEGGRRLVRPARADDHGGQADVHGIEEALAGGVLQQQLADRLLARRSCWSGAGGRRPPARASWPPEKLATEEVKTTRGGVPQRAAGLQHRERAVRGSPSGRGRNRPPPAAETTAARCTTTSRARAGSRPATCAGSATSPPRQRTREGRRHAAPARRQVEQRQPGDRRARPARRPSPGAAASLRPRKPPPPRMVICMPPVRSGADPAALVCRRAGGGATRLDSLPAGAWSPMIATVPSACCINRQPARPASWCCPRAASAARGRRSPPGPATADAAASTLPDVAAAARVGSVHYKDEGGRFGLGSFKALGGAYAVMKLLQAELAQPRRRANAATAAELDGGQLTDATGAITVTCATDGNHGRSRRLGRAALRRRCVIFVHERVSQGRRDAIARLWRRDPRRARQLRRRRARRAGRGRDAGLVRRLRHLLCRLHGGAARRDAGLPR